MSVEPRPAEAHLPRWTEYAARSMRACRYVRQWLTHVGSATLTSLHTSAEGLVLAQKSDLSFAANAIVPRSLLCLTLSATKHAPAIVQFSLWGPSVKISVVRDNQSVLCFPSTQSILKPPPIPPPPPSPPPASQPPTQKHVHISLPNSRHMQGFTRPPCIST